MLYVVATPIGNMSDITFRAIEILKEVSLIACEDTRQTRKILARYEISTHCISCHAHNEMYSFEKHILPLLKNGESVALVSDSGTPLVSDPGAKMVEATYEQGIEVVPIPGASAVTAIMSISGLHGKGFWFEGFLGRKSGARNARLSTLIEKKEAFILFESPYRLVKLLGEIADIDSTVKVLFARELTKKFETTMRGTAKELFEVLSAKDGQVKGECVVLVYP